MNKSRLIILAIAIVAGFLAFLLATPTPEPVVVAPTQPIIETEDVLTASRELPLGTVVTDADFNFLQWPRAAVGQGMITRALNPTILQDLRGSVVRSSLMQNEPVRREKLVKGTSSGFLSAVLPTGRRAVSVGIDPQGTASAGGFILPNDRVDIVQTSRADAKDAGKDGYVTETILSDIRVLAIGQVVQETAGQRTVTGVNATLEVSPAQAEQLVLAQRLGGLSLILRSMLDAGRQSEKQEEDQPTKREGMTIIRFGVVSNVTK